MSRNATNKVMEQTPVAISRGVFLTLLMIADTVNESGVGCFLQKHLLALKCRYADPRNLRSDLTKLEAAHLIVQHRRAGKINQDIIDLAFVDRSNWEELRERCEEFGTPIPEWLQEAGGGSVDPPPKGQGEDQLIPPFGSGGGSVDPGGEDQLIPPYANPKHDPKHDHDPKHGEEIKFDQVNPSLVFDKDNRTLIRYQRMIKCSPSKKSVKGGAGREKWKHISALIENVPGYSDWLDHLTDHAGFSSFVDFMDQALDNDAFNYWLNVDGSWLPGDRIVIVTHHSHAAIPIQPPIEEAETFDLDIDLAPLSEEVTVLTYEEETTQELEDMLSKI